jgi:catechol 2,3-dioxygenase-like lactoylglutathione lyase family enzyme
VTDRGRIFMLKDRRCATTIAVADIDRAVAWYRDKLGFEPVEKTEGGVVYECAGGTRFSLYPSPFAGTAQSTLMGWETAELESDMEELRGRGVTFEEYDLPGLKTENGIADMGGERGAWFKDSEGNILALSEYSG